MILKEIFSSGGLEPTKTSSPPPDVLERSVVSYSSTILATRRSVRRFSSSRSFFFFQMFPFSSSLISYTDVVTAGDDRVGRRGIRPELAPDAPALRDRRRPEALLLDDRDVDTCTALSAMVLCVFVRVDVQ